ncbi:unnamed protein product [Linum tenue]|uniref:Protein kinase domain-containing protein n=1 Tax=Linum tenue TaxID=586396 RepID=A0AAV0PE46_9ROSI|nr:unnamed protein product [Linum tenue]
MNTAQEIAYDFFLSLLAIILIFLNIALLISCCNKPSSETQPEDSSPAGSVSTAAKARAYQLSDIDAATDGFNPLRIIGQGSSGTVYAAVFPGDDDQLVAVKRIHPSLVLLNAGLEFSSVIKTLSSAHHPNIAPVLGHSQAPGERIVAMEFVGIQNLNHLLHESAEGLDWSRRLTIAAGAARGIEYLHNQMAPGTIHGCVKPSKVLIDSKFRARVCDYGICFNGRRGIVGYVDAEYWNRGASKESDVYGFGVVLLELLTGRKSEEGLLVKWAVPLLKEMRFGEVLDPRLVAPSDMKLIVRLGKVASACVGNCRMSRPTMVQVAAILNCLELDHDRFGFD